VIVALGCAPGLGFVHTGHILSFVFDIADLYKTQVAIPVAFDIAAAGVADIGADTRDRMKGSTFLETCVRDIKALLLDEDDGATEFGPEALDAVVVMLWDENGRRVAAGTSYGSPHEDYVETDPSYAEVADWLEEDL
jgi:CRISPR-associated protein Cas1